MKKLFFTLLILSLSLVLSACGSSDVETGGDGNSTEKKEETTESNEANTEDTEEESTNKTIDATSNSVDVLGMKVGLGEIEIREDGISVGVNLENASDDVLTFYPDQGSIVVGDMQIDANLFMGTGDIGGDVQPGVKQDAVIEFPAPDGKTIDIESITEIRLIFGDVTTSDWMTSEPVEFTVPVE